MTPFELSNTISRELSAYTPRLCAAINRALLQIGEGSVLVGLGPGQNQNDVVDFEERESVKAEPDKGHLILFKMTQMLSLLEAHSNWKVLVDRRPAPDPDQIDFHYTLIRHK